MRRDDSSPPTTTAVVSQDDASAQPITSLQQHLAVPGQFMPTFFPIPLNVTPPTTSAAHPTIYPFGLLPHQRPLLGAPQTPFPLGYAPGQSVPTTLPAYQKVQMQIAVQPPAKTVYQRILKPFPSVYLALPPMNHGDMLAQLCDSLNAKTHEEGVFVEATVIRHDNGDILERSIDGQTTARLEKSGWNTGVYTATFKKIKLLTTSQQKSGAKFSLSFRLKCSSMNLGSLAEMVVVSNPIEVFSHSQYLGKSEEEARARSPPGALKYADNPAVLHLKLMESIQAFKELGGSQETLINYVFSIYSHSTPLLSALPGMSIFPQPAVAMEDALQELQLANPLGQAVSKPSSPSGDSSPQRMNESLISVPSAIFPFPPPLASSSRLLASAVPASNPQTMQKLHNPSPLPVPTAILPSIASLLASTVSAIDEYPAASRSQTSSPTRPTSQPSAPPGALSLFSLLSSSRTPLHALTEAVDDALARPKRRREEHNVDKTHLPSEASERTLPTKGKRRRRSTSSE